jgi:hypothetical protein
MRARAISVNFARVQRNFRFFRILVSLFRQDFFASEQKIKFRFFLVDLADDF